MTVEVQDLGKSYGSTFSLKIPSLRIERGESFGLVGNNGAGKTTFLRLVLDLLQADQGRIAVDGQDVAKSTSWKGYTGSYLDEGFLLDFLTPSEFFEFVGSVYNLPQGRLEEAIAPYRSFFPNGTLAPDARYIRDLSKGNAKKVGIVAALFVQPRLLILDEPFANLDPGSQIQLKVMLSQMNMLHDTTMIISSHDLIHVTEICNRIAVLEDGRIVRDQSTSEATLQELELYFASRMG